MERENAEEGFVAKSVSDDVSKTQKLDPEVQARLDAVWKQAYGARTKQDLQDFYAGWSASYDADHEAIGFFGHTMAAELLHTHLGVAPGEARLLDAGAGTGAAGEALKRLGYGDITACDFSEAMLEVAGQKGLYRSLHPVDLGLPLDLWRADTFDAAILVGVYSYGQAPAHSLDELVRVVKPGGKIVFTSRCDFFAEDAMGVRSTMERLVAQGAWREVEVSEEAQYLPNKEPEVMFRVWCYEVLESKRQEVPEGFAEAVREALTAEGPVKVIDHMHIWDSMASRLYDAYIERPEYYLTNTEESILQANEAAIAGDEQVIVELGSGSARKISHILDGFVERHGRCRYLPIDLSLGALRATKAQVKADYGDKVEVETLHGAFLDKLAEIPAETTKVILFFGSSIGNLPSCAATVEFLRSIRERMTPGDRFVLGADLHKDKETLEAAYNAGEENFRFFVHMVRRINVLLGADFDLGAFRLGSTYEADPPEGAPYDALEPMSVRLKVVTTRDQTVTIPGLGGLEVALKAGDAVQVGTSRKFHKDKLAALGALAGMRLRTQWADDDERFSVNEFVRDDA